VKQAQFPRGRAAVRPAVGGFVLETVAISITDSCNLSCSHCGDYKTRSEGGHGSAGRQMGRRELSRLFSDIAKRGVGMITLSGGEPLLRPDLLSIIDDLGDAGLRCALLTNGTLLTRKFLERLKAGGIVDHLRFSVEYPERVLRAAGSCHDAGAVFAAVRLTTGCGMKAGVNMTLLPDNMQYALELARASADSGAEFFRAVPLLPSGRAANSRLPASFFAECTAVALSLRAAFGTHPFSKGRGARGDGKPLSLSEAARFACSCAGGSRTLSISADGRAHICAMIGLGGKEIYVTDRPLDECLETLRRRRNRLQRMMFTRKQSICTQCVFATQCRGGCIAEWTAASRTAERPWCMVKCLAEAVKMHSRETPLMASAARELLDEYETSLLFNGPSPCVRALPLWTIRLD